MLSKNFRYWESIAKFVGSGLSPQITDMPVIFKKGLLKYQQSFFYGRN